MEVVYLVSKLLGGIRKPSVKVLVEERRSKWAIGMPFEINC